MKLVVLIALALAFVALGGWAAGGPWVAAVCVAAAAAFAAWDLRRIERQP